MFFLINTVYLSIYLSSKELAGKLSMVGSLLRKSLASLTKDDSYELRVEDGSQRSGVCVQWGGY